MKVLGLDVSSARTGVTVVESDGTNAVRRLFIGHIDLTKVDGLWAKADATRAWFRARIQDPAFYAVDMIGVEEACLGFGGGATSANTLTTLIRINALTSYVVRDMFASTPEFIPPASARKACGLKLQQVKKCGVPVKQQVFDQMIVDDLKDMAAVWPRKKPSTKNPVPGYKDFCYDECDSYVIAKATLRLFG